MATKQEDADMRKREFVKLLSEIPAGVWERIVTKEPEWQTMKPFLDSFGFGPFAVLMVAAGLNDFQLKGKAGVVYWPLIRKMLEGSPPPKSPTDTYDILRPFYQNERLKELKVRRLGRFLKSSLASELWQSSPKKLSEDFLNIWFRLARTMGQEPQKKTVVFAMKCLGLSLLMSGQSNFEFRRIPIPVDSRVQRLTKQLGFQFYRAEEVRKFWDKILSMLRESNPHVTMIHLDSLVWQIASMNKQESQNYFAKLGIPDLGEQISSLLQS